MLRGLLALGLFCLVGSCANVPGYKIVSGSEKATSWGMQAELSLLPNSGSPYGMDFQNLQLNVTHISSNIVRVQIYPSNDEQRWRVPENILKGPAANKTTTDTANLQYSVTLQQNPFSLAITRKSDGEVFFNSSQATDEFNGLIFSEQYIEWSTQLDTTPYIYGLGERVDSFLLNASQNSKPYGMFNRDQGAARRQLNLYGTHPMYLRMNSNNSRAHGSFMLNTNAMDVTLRPNFLTWKLIGGIIDLFFFIPSEMSEPEQVVELYTSIIGRSFLPSYYILGRHQCRWGYNTIEETQQVVERYAMHDIPLDSMWNDIDYMDNYLDFTTDPVRFPIAAMKEFTNYLHERGQHYLIIVDPGIAVQSGYPPYEQGLAGNIFLMDWTKSQAIEGKVWPGVTVFPDFSAKNTSTWWETAIQQFYDSGVYFDGLWADMSEPASFCSGTCPTTPISTPPNDVLDNPPYLPVNAPLNTSTVSMSAQGALGYQYNAHNLYGYAETKTTYNALKKLLNTRPFVMPRSTFASSGYYGAHWLGDNFSTWEYLRNSIAGVLSFQLFGIPIVGADICGFNLETTDELCTRWEQLGAFYPFSRNHNHRAMRAQEPYALSEQHLLITKNAIRLRYSLLPYFYSLAFNAHRNGSVIWRPLFFSFPSDSNCYSIDEQFMVGKAMLVSPVLSQGETTVDAYFPAGIWFDFYSGAMVSNNQNNGTWITLDAPIDTINVHLLGGSIVVMQAGGLTTSESRNNPMELLIQLSAANRASGFLIIDDGKSLDTVENLLYTEIQFMVQYDESVSNYTLSSNVLMEGYDSGMFLGSIRVSGVTRAPTSVTVNGTSITTFTYSALSNVLKVSGLLLPITSLHSIVF